MIAHEMGQLLAALILYKVDRYSIWTMILGYRVLNSYGVKWKLVPGLDLTGSFSMNIETRPNTDENKI